MKRSRHIVLVSCVKSKRREAARAVDLYVSDWFRSAMAFARSLDPDLIFILSAKHGLVGLDEHIEPYEVTLNRMGVRERKEWAAQVLEQLREHADLDGDRFTVLAGKRYREFLLSSLRKACVPMEGLRQGEQLRFLKEQAQIARVEAPDLRKEFIEVERVRGEVVVQVREIHWDGPHTPHSQLVTFCKLPGHATEEQVADAVNAALSNPRFFGTCERCQRRLPKGWMHTEALCQSCAERHLGVVY